jgi:hypothetical protein
MDGQYLPTVQRHPQSTSIQDQSGQQNANTTAQEYESISILPDNLLLIKREDLGIDDEQLLEPDVTLRAASLTQRQSSDEPGSDVKQSKEKRPSKGIILYTLALLKLYQQENI